MFLWKIIAHVRVFHRLRRLEMDEAALNAKLDAMTAQVGKIGTETSASLAMIKTLQDQIAALIAGGSKIPQSVVDKINALATQLQVVDDLVPDAPPSPPAP